MKLSPCRYLKTRVDGGCVTMECRYWDVDLTEDETLRCQMPGCWSEDCYEEDNDGIIYEGKWLTAGNFVMWVQDKDEIPEYVVNRILSLAGDPLIFILDIHKQLCPLCEKPKGIIHPNPDPLLQCTACGSVPERREGRVN